MYDAPIAATAIRPMIRKWAIDSGWRVEQGRKAKGLSRADMAAAIETSEVTVIRIESGHINPRDHMRLAIAATLGVEVEELWPYPRRAEVLAHVATAA
jgi:DNA-binding XRE family transcriptional regulator